jgi:hypothetical protein
MIKATSHGTRRRKAIMVRMNPEGWKELKSLSTELTVSTGEHVTMQALATEAINTLLEAHGKPPAA